MSDGALAGGVPRQPSLKSCNHATGDSSQLELESRSNTYARDAEGLVEAPLTTIISPSTDTVRPKYVSRGTPTPSGVNKVEIDQPSVSSRAKMYTLPSNPGTPGEPTTMLDSSSVIATEMPNIVFSGISGSSFAV